MLLKTNNYILYKNIVLYKMKRKKRNLNKKNYFKTTKQRLYAKKKSLGKYNP